MPEEFVVDTNLDIELTTAIYKGMPYSQRERFAKSADGKLFFRKVKYSPLFKSLPSTTARMVDMLSGTCDPDTYAKEGQIGGAHGEPIQEENPAVYKDKEIFSNVAESMVQASVSEPVDGWTKTTDLMRYFKASPQSVEKSLENAVLDGRIAKSVHNNQTVYACC
jgi:hypothetical protein